MSRILVNLKDNGNELVPQVFGGFNTKNVLSSCSKTGSFTYTATEDCWIVWTSQLVIGVHYFRIDDVNVAITADLGNNTPVADNFILKKGQKLTGIGGNSSYGITYTAYSLKY